MLHRENDPSSLIWQIDLEMKHFSRNEEHQLAKSQPYKNDIEMGSKISPISGELKEICKIYCCFYMRSHKEKTFE